MDITTVDIGIRRVKLLRYAVDETLYRGKNEDDKLNLQFQHFITINVSEDELIFTLRVFYSYADAPDTTLIDFHVQNVFFVRDFKNYVMPKNENQNDINLNDNAWSIIAGLSLTHTRAFMSNSIADTIYKHFIIPIVNPLAFARRLLELRTIDSEETENAST
jgi:hypothetical protein